MMQKFKRFETHFDKKDGVIFTHDVDEQINEWIREFDPNIQKWTHTHVPNADNPNKKYDVVLIRYTDLTL